MSCFRHEDDWGPPEHGSEPSAVCFRLLFGGYCAVWCDVGHGLTARDGRGLALHVVQLPAVVICRGTIRERHVYGQINVYGVTTKSERHNRSYWTRTADGNGIGGRKAPVPYGS